VDATGEALGNQTTRILVNKNCSRKTEPEGILGWPGIRVTETQWGGRLSEQ